MLAYLLVSLAGLVGYWVDPALWIITYICYKGIDSKWGRFFAALILYWMVDLLLLALFSTRQWTLEFIFRPLLTTILFLILVELVCYIKNRKRAKKSIDSDKYEEKRIHTTEAFRNYQRKKEERIFNHQEDNPSDQGMKDFKEHVIRVLNSTDLQNEMYSQALYNLLDDGFKVTPNELPHSRGEFGRTKDNPIPVNGPIGEMTYLSKLLSRDGQRMLFQRVSSTDSRATKRPVDIFELISVDGVEKDTLYLDMYHLGQSSKAPRGYVLLSKLDGITGISSGLVMGGPEEFRKQLIKDTTMTFGIPIIAPEVLHQKLINKSFKSRNVSRQSERIVVENDEKEPEEKVKGILTSIFLGIAVIINLLWQVFTFILEFITPFVVLYFLYKFFIE